MRMSVSDILTALVQILASRLGCVTGLGMSHLQLSHKLLLTLLQILLPTAAYCCTHDPNIPCSTAGHSSIRYTYYRKLP